MKTLLMCILLAVSGLAFAQDKPAIKAFEGERVDEPQEAESKPESNDVWLNSDDEIEARSLEVNSMQAQEQLHSTAQWLAVQLASTEQQLFWQGLLKKMKLNPNEVIVCDGETSARQYKECAGTPKNRIKIRKLHLEKKAAKK